MSLLELQPGVIEALRQTPGAFLVQTGQTGGVTSLFLRGGNSTANLVTIDGMPADDVGGVFDFGTVSSAAVSKIDVVRGPDSAMYGTDAGAGVINIETPRGTTLKPLLNYEGDAGNLYTYRNQVSLGGTVNGWITSARSRGWIRRMRCRWTSIIRQHRRLNVGYDFNGNTQMRFTMRNADSVKGVPGPFDFQGLSQNNRQGDQDLYSGVTLENRYKGKWHNLVRYGIARKREQEQEFAAGGTYLDVRSREYGPGNVGNVVTIRGANGYTATGQVQLYHRQ